jgi:hypothetical protein
VKFYVTVLFRLTADSSEINGSALAAAGERVFIVGFVPFSPR